MISNEVEEREKGDIQFLEAREDAPEALDPAKEPLDFDAPLVEFPVKFHQSRCTSGDHWNQAQIQHQLPRLAVFLGLNVSPCEV
jgi:hypothetical protein